MLTVVQQHREIFEIFHEIFQGKKIHEILHHYLLRPVVLEVFTWATLKNL